MFFPREGNAKSPEFKARPLPFALIKEVRLHKTEFSVKDFAWNVSPLFEIPGSDRIRWPTISNLNHLVEQTDPINRTCPLQPLSARFFLQTEVNGFCAEIFVNVRRDHLMIIRPRSTRIRPASFPPNSFGCVIVAACSGVLLHVCDHLAY